MKRPFYIALVLATLISLAGCKEKQQAEVAEAQQVMAPDIRLYTLDGGTVMVNNLELFAQDSVYRGQTAEFADAYYVVVHPKGTLMWDAGLSQGLVGMPEPYTSPDGNFSVSRPDSLATQLAAIGMTPADIDFLSLSHTHFDHSGHAEALPGATWLVQESEYAWISSPEMEAAQPDMFHAVNDIEKVKQISGDYDVFGDGTVVIKYMPGHTPGHCALFLDLPQHGPLLLSGDLYHLELNRLNKRVPIFNSDVKQTLASMRAFEAFADSTGARVYLQHSRDDFNTMPQAPNYLK
ncbi:N-acyl homoserine lactonase family protein [Robiginitalea sediminis]|uniref:N-acyl homoserine lactonase family protein n=1 Tax=Robiginitalea sediminis TaxID=1982593 RepID=UPI000B4BFAA9|nr:N-acyl homoserine lactonase family protein [Robiginitalea sediminis]